MSNNEVKSLNDLAMAHGGHLTINPDTGLPEAGFLSSLLPMVAGAALASTGVGAPMAALMVGGGSYLMNPNKGLMGGLMAGLGAYGGYGLGEGLTSLGANSEAGLTSTGASTDYAAQNAETIKNAQAFEQAKLAQNAEAVKAAQAQTDLYSDFGPRGEFTNASAPLPTSPGGMNVTDPNRIIGADYEQVLPKGNLLQNPLAENQLGQSATGVDTMGRGIKSLVSDPTADKFKTLGGGSYTGLAKMGLAAAAPAAPGLLKPNSLNMPGSATAGKQVVPHYGFSPGMVTPTPQASATGKENTYFTPQYRALSDEEAKQMYPGYAPAVLPAADGGLMGYAAGGPVEQMSNNAAIGANTMYPMANMTTSAFATPYQDPRSTNMVSSMAPSGGGTVDAMSGEPNMQGTRLAEGGISDARYNLGGYSDGGRLLRGPGDGVSDSIPAVIGKKQPARLADGEFVVPARIVSELGNGSTEAGAKKLYAMMDRIQASRKNTVGKGKVAKNNRADKYLPA
jgi:hypothetical protein